MKKTKIIATIGPASNNEKMLRKMIKNGMNVARLNFSHGTLVEHAKTIKLIRRLASDLQKPIAILQDLPGPKFRIGKMPDNGVFLETGTEFILTTEQILGSSEIATVNYAGLPQDMKAKDQILLADGNIELQVKSTNETQVICKVISGGKLTSHKGVNVPSGNLKLNPFTTKDKEFLQFGIKHDVDFVALSFVQTSKEIKQAKKIISTSKKNISVIAKIERQPALENIDSIIYEADAIMIARGDLGVEIPLENVPSVQKDLIKKCNFAGKPVITATQMLGSMVASQRPTRAEASDVANAIFDGTDAIMLSEETAVGINPPKAVKFMTRIANQTEEIFPYNYHLHHEQKEISITNSVAHSACLIAKELGARAIIAYTKSGFTAQNISNFRPQTPIFALTPDIFVSRKLALCWNVFPMVVETQHETDSMLSHAENVLTESGSIKKNDIAVLTAGFPVADHGTTNLIKVMRIK
ncbi:MAG: pyruvate kinase [Candidatus Cloacimonetes bacterium]|nr:pyruvate kinase [Candidatus Cloacimonadota bacterium]